MPSVLSGNNGIIPYRVVRLYVDGVNSLARFSCAVVFTFISRL